MKFDFASVTHWGLDQEGPDGQNRFDLAVVELAKRLGGEIEAGDRLNGYSMAYQIVRGGERLLQCLTGGAGSADGSSMFVAASTADEVYPILQQMFPNHGVSRLDACEDYAEPGVWDKLEAMLAKVCAEHRVSMSPFGEGHVRPDGTRDATKGRSWYCGSKSSPFRIVLYEKGLEQLAKGIPADPNWVRLEVRIRPASKAKALVGGMGLKPCDLLGFSKWGLDVARYMGAEDIRRLRIGSVWKPGEQEQLCLKIVRMFDKGIERLIDQFPPDEIGRMLCEVHRKNREANEALRAEAT